MGVVFSLMTPLAVIGLCLSYSMGGDLPCSMWRGGTAAYVSDGYNVHRLSQVYGNVYSYTRNGEEAGHQLCKVTETSVNCLFGIKFNEN